MLELECLKVAVLKILKKGRSCKTKRFIPENEISLPKNLFILNFQYKYYFLNKERDLLTIIKSSNQCTLERTSTIINIPKKNSQIEYIYGIQIEAETTPLKKIKNW